MPNTLTGDETSFPPQTAPTRGEARTAESVQTPLKNAADRTAYLKDRLLYVDPTKEGVRRLRRFASVAALKAATDLTDKGVALIDGVALYEYDAASTATELSPAIITPTSVGVGAGRWIAVSFGNGALNVANGIPQLDASGLLPSGQLAAKNAYSSGSRIDPSNLKNGLVQLYTASYAGPFSTTSTAYVDVPSLQPGFTLKAWDRVLFSGSGTQYQEDLAPGTIFTQLVVVKPDTTVATVAQSEQLFSPAAVSKEHALAIGTYYTATADGDHTFKLQVKGFVAGGATVTLKNLNLVAHAVRP